jgi:ABC-type multidrug transport system ATPase subunit
MATLVQISKASKSYGGQVLLENADAVISDKTKVGFVGRNGAGKSTLLRILLGEEELDSGEVIRHTNLRLGYLRQHDPFLPNETTLEFLMRDSGQPDWRCGEVAGQFEIKGAYLDGPITKLSGGWQTRAKAIRDVSRPISIRPSSFVLTATKKIALLARSKFAGFRCAIALSLRPSVRVCRRQTPWFR